MSKENNSPSLPDLNWKQARCDVCGETFDYMSKRRPPTCKKGECKYKYEYKIDPQTWASHQPGLFDDARR
jgi:hypothetical protein